MENGILHILSVNVLKILACFQRRAQKVSEIFEFTCNTVCVACTA